MDKEKLIKQIMAECEKDGEPVTYEEASEMAEMEVKAGNIKTYVTDKKRVSAPKKVKISDEKQMLFNDLVSFLENNYTFEVEKPNKLLVIFIGDKKFKLDLIETRQKK